MIKKILGWATFRAIVAGIIFLAVLGVTSFFNGHDYNITKYRQDVSVNSNGSAFVKKTVSYKFEGDHKGIRLREIGGKDTKFINSNMNNLEIKLNNGPWHTTNDIDEKANSKRKIAIKVYQHLEKGDKLQVRYWYNVSGLAKKWHDTAEVNWLLADTWAVPLHDVRVTVKLPRYSGKVQAWGHTEFGNTNQINVAGQRVTLTSPEVNANGRIELHTLFAKEALNGTGVVHKTGNRIDTARKVERHVVLSNTIRTIFMVAVYISLVIGFGIVLVYSWRIKQHKWQIKDLITAEEQAAGVNMPVVHIYETPSDVGPAIGFKRQMILVQQDVSEDEQDQVRLWYATIVDLIARRYVLLNVVDGQNFKFERTNKQDGLAPFELKALDILFAEDARVISNKDFENRSSAVSKALKKQLHSFMSLVDNQAALKNMKNHNLSKQAETLLDFSMSRIQKVIVIVALLLALLTHFVSQANIWSDTLATILAMFAMMNWLGKSVTDTTVLTQDAYREVYKWDGFRYMLEDISNLSRADLPDVILWDRIFAFAVVYDIVTEVSEYLPSLMTQDERTVSPFVSTNNILPAVVTYSIMDSLFHENGVFASDSSSENATSYSDSSSGFDGFSGGDGGSGGDAF